MEAQTTSKLRITISLLEDMPGSGSCACDDGVAWYERQQTDNLHELYQIALNQRQYYWIHWFILHTLTGSDLLDYAMFAAQRAHDIAGEQAAETAMQRVKDCIPHMSSEYHAGFMFHANQAVLRAVDALGIYHYDPSVHEMWRSILDHGLSLVVKVMVVRE